MKIVTALAKHPSLWAVALVQVFALAAPGWWHRRPFLPLPDAEYLAFRMEAMYGDQARPPVPADVVAYLHWCRSMDALSR